MSGQSDLLAVRRGQPVGESGRRLVVCSYEIERRESLVEIRAAG